LLSAVVSRLLLLRRLWLWSIRIIMMPTVQLRTARLQLTARPRLTALLRNGMTIIANHRRLHLTKSFCAR
jgi:hypothetical protein